MKSLLNFNDDNGEMADIDVVSRSSVFLSRNLADTPFPWRSSLVQLAESRRRIIEAVKRCDDGFVFESMESVPKEALHLALERGFLAETASASGAGAFSLSADAQRSILVNEREHACFGVHHSGRPQARDVEKLLSLDTELEKSLSWAFTPAQGYIQTTPDDIGSGLRFSCRVFLPAIVAAGIWDRVARGLVASGILVSRLSCDESEGSANPDGPESSWVDMSCKAGSGLSEHEALDAFLSSLDILCDTERKARSRQREVLEKSVEDCLWRAVALLRSARLLEEGEARMLLSRVRFAVLLGVFPDLDRDKTCLFIDKLGALASNNAIRTGKVCKNELFEDILETQLRADSIRMAMENHFPPL